MFEAFPQQSPLMSRICVRPPYFALGNLELLERGNITCDFVPEMVPNGEGAVSLAEAARHGAIAGLTAAASSRGDDDRHYYLARTGSVTRVGAADLSGPFSISAQGALPTSREARADFVVRADGTPLYRGHVDYSVFTPSAFEKFFGYLEHPGEGSDGTTESPYGTSPDVDIRSLDHTQANATTGVSPQECAGHFDGYPAMPVAHLLGSMFGLGATLAAESTGSDTAVPENGDLVDARVLIPPRATVELTAAVVASSDAGCTVEQVASVSGNDAVLVRTDYACS
ncbi:hypothetical protein AAFP35_11865 [Gordonia sp. CPCC 206044]|uniref:hypothetical protein n=1 Tax=Gordonia sp. CPCC 206044 TaxID=3140793 RepID=UPI003AF34557